MTTWWFLKGLPLMQAYLGIASCNPFSNHNIDVYDHVITWWGFYSCSYIWACDLFPIFSQIVHFSNVLKWRYAWHLCWSSSHVLHLFASSKLLDINHSKCGSFITESWLSSSKFDGINGLRGANTNIPAPYGWLIFTNKKTQDWRGSCTHRSEY